MHGYLSLNFEIRPAEGHRPPCSPIWTLWSLFCHLETDFCLAPSYHDSSHSFSIPHLLFCYCLVSPWFNRSLADRLVCRHHTLAFRSHAIWEDFSFLWKRSGMFRLGSRMCLRCRLSLRYRADWRSSAHSGYWAKTFSTMRWSPVSWVTPAGLLWWFPAESWHLGPLFYRQFYIDPDSIIYPQLRS